VSISPIAYPFEEFAQHFEALDIVRGYQYVTRHSSEVYVGDDRSLETNILRVWDYFHQLYPRDIAMEKGSQFMLIVDYLAENMSRFDVGTLAVSGSDESASLVSERLLRAVHFACTHMTEAEYRGRGPDPQHVVELAETTFSHY
jgi:hypothetical protein